MFKKKVTAVFVNRKVREMTSKGSRLLWKDDRQKVTLEADQVPNQLFMVKEKKHRPEDSYRNQANGDLCSPLSTESFT